MMELLSCNSLVQELWYGYIQFHLTYATFKSAQEPYGFIGGPFSLASQASGADGSVPLEGNNLIDFAWSPTDPHRFALVTQAGELRMFTMDLQNSQNPFNLAGNLQKVMEVKCCKFEGNFYFMLSYLYKTRRIT